MREERLTTIRSNPYGLSRQIGEGASVAPNSKGFDLAFKRFCIRHGVMPDELGKHESRTMDYKTDFPGKKRRIAECRREYGKPEKWVRKVRKVLG